MTSFRHLLSRTRGQSQGAITRLIDPYVLGEKLKPFVFLDYFEARVQPGFGFGMHPHSGLATLTWQPHTDVRYHDTTGQSGVLPAGGVEWMNAGGGAWHRGHLLGQGMAKGIQLWVAMPPEIEEATAVGLYIPPAAVPLQALPDGQMRVLLGRYGNSGSSIPAHQDMFYGVLELRNATEYHVEVPSGHDVCWACLFEGQAMIAGVRASRAELLVFGGAGRIKVKSAGPAAVLIGTAKRHEFPLVLGGSSVHTNPKSLMRSQHRIRQLGRELAQAGQL